MKQFDLISDYLAETSEGFRIFRFWWRLGRYKPPKRMLDDHFRSEGFLQEANRQWFHPRGLSLVMIKEGDMSGFIVMDYRDCEGGPIFEDHILNKDKANHVNILFKQTLTDRLRLYGWVYQPIEG